MTIIAYIVCNVVVTLLVILTNYWFMPPMTLFYWPSVFYFTLVFAGYVGANKFAATFMSNRKAEKKVNRVTNIMLLIAAGALGLSLLVAFTNSQMVSAKRYAAIIDPPTLTDISEYTPTVESVPLMDRNTAELLMNRKLGTLVNEVSQFELGRSYQITVDSVPYRIAPLAYGDIFKYWNNSSTGIPAYLVVNMQTQDVEIKWLEHGIRYSPSAAFGDKLSRHVHEAYPSAILGDPVFEVTDDWTPVWIIPEMTNRIGLFGGKDVDGIFIVDAVTGTIKHHGLSDIPAYVDNVYPADKIIEQYDWYGSYRDGFLNAFFGQKGITATTDGYNYIAQGDDIYLYTGVTSVGGDESNIGFIYVNLRTKEMQYFLQPGAEEYSAMSSAEGVVPDKGYKATFPLLLMIEDQPTYLMQMKDDGGLVKMYALVNVERYQIVVVTDTLNQCLAAYRTALLNNGQAVTEKTGDDLTGTVEFVRIAPLDGVTYVYAKLSGADYLVRLRLSDNEFAVMIEQDDVVSVFVYDEYGDVRDATLVSIGSKYGG